MLGSLPQGVVENGESSALGYSYAALMFCGLVIGTLCDNQHFQRVMRAGMHWAPALAAHLAACCPPPCTDLHALACSPALCWSLHDAIADSA
jgi:hypothetical protein